MKKKKKSKTKYHLPPIKFDIALRKYIPDISAIKKFKKKLKKKDY